LARSNRLIARRTLTSGSRSAWAPLADGGARYVPVSMLWAEGAASLVLVEGDRTLLAVPIEKAPPRLTVDFNPRPAATDKPFALRWQTAGAAGKSRVGILVRASVASWGPETRSWRNLSLGEHTIELRADAFPDRAARVTVTVAEGAPQKKSRRRG
jgi:hypothetical protein